MKRFLGMGALALALAGVPTQQAAANFKFNLGLCFNLNFEYSGSHWFAWGCGHGHHGGDCFGHHDGDYIAVMPGHANHAPAAPAADAEPFPPQPERRGDRKREEVNLQWGYPSLGYSYYHPVSYYPQQHQSNHPAATYYYPQHYHYPANYGYPSYYHAPSMTFDR
ncbi:MAG: hypothetical protein L0Y71_11255 [Gemmataceae bacterium]|nr:hypothetical protein [Gemmataceae bacterium]